MGRQAGKVRMHSEWRTLKSAGFNLQCCSLLPEGTSSSLQPLGMNSTEQTDLCIFFCSTVLQSQVIYVFWCLVDVAILNLVSPCVGVIVKLA